VRLANLSKAMSKWVWKLDSGEDVFEADDMMKWEGGWTLWVEARRRRRGDSRVCPRCNLTYLYFLMAIQCTHSPARARRSQTCGKSELQDNRSELIYETVSPAGPRLTSDIRRAFDSSIRVPRPIRARHLSNRTLLAGMEGGPRGDHTIVIGV